jgi:hypothetical protein
VSPPPPGAGWASPPPLPFLDAGIATYCSRLL